MEEIPILEVVIGKEQIQMEEENIKAFREQKTLTKVKEVESFLRFVNFYKISIKNFNHTTKPLKELKGKKEQTWTGKHQQAFEELKEKIMSLLVLFLFRRKSKFRIETDALGHAIGRVLFQEQEGEWKLMAFLSITMQQAERNYKIYDKEPLAIMETLTKWRQYLLDVIEQFEIWIDYENFKYFRESHKLNE